MAFINELYVGSNRNTSFLNKVEVFLPTPSSTLSAAWSGSAGGAGWKIVVKRVRNGSTSTYNTSLKSGFVEKYGFVTNTTAAIYLRNSTSVCDLALIDENGLVIDYLSLNGKGPQYASYGACSANPTLTLSNSPTDIYLDYDGNVKAGLGWQTSTTTNTIGYSNTCDKTNFNLIMDKSADTSTPALSDNVTFTLTVRNSCKSNATTFNITDILPSGLTYQKTGSTCSTTLPDGSTSITKSFSSLATNTSISCIIVAKTTALGSITNFATVTTTQTESTIADNNDSSIITVKPGYEISFDMDAQTLSEGDLGGTITVLLSAPNSTKEIWVDYNLSSTSTATNPSDHNLANGTVKFLAGKTTVDVPFTLVDDTKYEDTETMIITLSNPRLSDGTKPASLSLSTPSPTTPIVQTITIEDDDPPVEYQMDECSWKGTTGEVQENSGNPNGNFADLNGTAFNSATTTNLGKVYWGGDFTKATDYVNIGHPTLDYSNNTLTIMAWINWQIVPSTGNAWSNIFSYNSSTATNSAPFGLQHDSTNNKFEFAVTTSAGRKYATSVATTQQGVWQHVVGVYDGAKLIIYVNGAPSTTLTTQTGTITPPVADAKLQIGQWAYPSGSRNFNGYIDEVKYFATALTATQISSMYNYENNGLNYDGSVRVPSSCTVPVSQNCTAFSYQLYHPQSTTNKLLTRISSQVFDLNTTVSCTSGTGTIPARKIKNIYAVSGICPVATTGLPLLWSGLADINDTNRTITLSNLNSTKAYSNIKLMLETNSSELNCSMDSFAIRPSYFSGNISDFKAGEQNSSSITTIDANDTINTNTLDYNTTVSTYRDISIASGCESNTTATLIDNMSVTFKDGKSTLVNAKFKDVGDFNTTLFDSSWNDGDCISGSGSNTLINGLYGCNVEGNISIKVSPYELNTTLTNFLPTSSWLYLDSSRTQNVEINATVSAYGKDGNISQNFSDGCSASSVPFGFYFTPTGTLPTTDLNVSLTPTSLDNTYDTVFNHQSFNIPNTSFKNGDANLSLKFNFIRPTIPINPFNLKLTDIKTSSGFNDNNATITDKNATFVYGRIHASDIQTDQNTSVPNPVEIEVYSNDSTNPFIIGKPQNVLKWYRNTDHDNNLSGSVLSGQSTKDIKITIDNTSTNPLNNGIQTIYITNTDSNTTKQTINLTIPSWLSTTTANNTFQYQYVIPSTTIDTLTTTSTGVNSGTFTGSDFGIAPAKTTKKGIKVFR